MCSAKQSRGCQLKFLSLSTHLGALIISPISWLLRSYHRSHAKSLRSTWRHHTSTSQNCVLQFHKRNRKAQPC